MSKSGEALDQIADILDGLPAESQAEIIKILRGSESDAPGGRNVVPDYAIYYNQTDEEIEKLIKSVEPELDRWWGIISHLNATTFLEGEKDMAKLENEVEIAYLEDSIFVSGRAKRILDGLRYWCRIRLNDARGGHRANMIKERVTRTILQGVDRKEKQRRMFGL